MMRQLISLLLSNAVVLLLCTSSFGVSFQGENEAKQTAEDVKARIEKLGTGTTRVKIKLRDKTKLEGYVQQIGEEHFVISDLETDDEIRVAYSQVLHVKEIKDRHLPGRKLFTIAAVISALFVIAGTWPDKP
jgi:hypothetical protein